MAKHPTSRRVHREHHDDDAFVAAAVEGSVWARENSRILTIAAIVAVVAIGGFLYMRNFQQQKAAQAATELSAVRQTVMDGNRQLAMKDLRNFVTKYGNTPSADEARLLLAQVYMEEGKPGEAVNVVKKMAGDPGEAGGATAALLLGAAYEGSKQVDQAERTYLDVADEARFGFEKREALERAAAIRLSKGNVPGAAELYERAMNTLPEDSPDRATYQMRIAEARAAAGRGS